MAQEVQREHDFRQAKGAGTHPPLEEALRDGWPLAPAGAVDRQGKQRGLLTAGTQHNTIYSYFICSMAMLFTILQGLSTHRYSIIQNIIKIWWHLPAIEVALLRPPGVKHTHAQHNPEYCQNMVASISYWGSTLAFLQQVGASPLIWIGPTQKSHALPPPISLRKKYSSGSVHNRKVKNTALKC